ncbi:MAG: ATP-binding protein [Bacteroidia bacterium]|nr:ATP-binding protein [Sphingobacteriaceae bacterium]MBP9070175.1 ATP-binding protein [Bacteroidia bacterium]
MEKALILLRGLPGAGKSTLAKQLSESGKYPVLSIDSYFTNEKGEYDFKFDDNHKAYKACEQQTEEALKNNSPKVFIDNTFTLDWEMEPYFKLASKYNYQLHVLTVENYHNSRNIHNVSTEQLQKMAEKYKTKLL